MKSPLLYYLSPSQIASLTRLASPTSPPPTMKLPAVVCDAARRGWKIFPALALSKHAPIYATMIGEATSDQTQLEDWARQYIGSNWAVATGQESGVFAAEIDGLHGRASWRNLNESAWDTESLMAQAGGNANLIHVYYRWPPGRAIRNLCSSIAPGLRLRGEGDWVLIPPSQCSNGARYFYSNNGVGVASAPSWLIDLAFEASDEGDGTAARPPPRRGGLDFAVAFNTAPARPPESPPPGTRLPGTCEW